MSFGGTLRFNFAQNTSLLSAKNPTSRALRSLKLIPAPCCGAPTYRQFIDRGREQPPCSHDFRTQLPLRLETAWSNILTKYSASLHQESAFRAIWAAIVLSTITPTALWLWLWYPPARVESERRLSRSYLGQVNRWRLCQGLGLTLSLATHIGAPYPLGPLSIS